jgi:cysteine desulfurase
MTKLTQSFISVPSKARVCLGHNATTPPDARVLEKLSSWALDWGNPSSIHQAGRGPKTRIRESRDFIAKMIGSSSLEVIFTAGGSESNNTAVRGALQALRRKGDTRRHILTSALEHPSLRRVFDSLAVEGYEVELVPVDRSGRIQVSDVEARLRPGETVFCSFMLVNNETGVIQPVKEIAKLAKAAGALVHTDAVQALGRIDVNVHDLGVDYASFAGHKFYALRGAGVLFVSRGAPLDPLIYGGGQERNRRGGTENTLAIASMGFMCSLNGEMQERSQKMRELRDLFEQRVLREIPESSITAGESPRIASTSSLLLPGTDGETLLMSLDMDGFAVSTGAACSSGSPEPSPVLLAMGLSRDEAQCSLRVGLGWSTTREEIELFIEALKKITTRLRGLRNWQPTSVEIRDGVSI